MIFSLYEDADYDRFLDVLRSLQLLEDDYLGGLGSRGSGQVAFENLEVSARSCENYGYRARCDKIPEKDLSVQGLIDATELLEWIRCKIPILSKE